MDKKNLILDALLELIKTDKGSTCTISDIAKQAGIAKGGIYYYFKSKEEIMDALVERSYGKVIEHCRNELEKHQLPVMEMMKLFFFSYYSSFVEPSLDKYLHHPQNAYSHQKSLTYLFTHLTPLITKIIEQGIKEKVFICPFPQEIAEIILGEFCFVFDLGLFNWSKEEIEKKSAALSYFLENVLSAPKDSFAFIKHFTLINN